MDRLNNVLESHEVEYRFTLPHRFFNRQIGASAAINVNPSGAVISAAAWQAHLEDWLPTSEDLAFVGTLMNRVTEPGKIAAWIAPPVRGVNGKPWEYEYVRFN
mgnify:FL=1